MIHNVLKELIIKVFVALVFRRYDPSFIATSLDEAYLNITNICTERGITGEEVILNVSPIVTAYSLLASTLGLCFLLWIILLFQHASTS